MKIQSMTGFARVEGSDDTARWTWELRSVNGKSLDLRFRLPAGMEALEIKIRDLAATFVKRGNIQIHLNLDHQARVLVPVLNEVNFDAAVNLAKMAAKRSGLAEPSIASILAVKGVVDYRESHENEELISARNENIFASFKDAISSLSDARSSEGTSIAKALHKQIEQIESLKDKIVADKSRSAKQIRERMTEQLSRLIDQSNTLDPQRLHQEAAILATKSDLQEELDRLEVHITAARDLLKLNDAIGRKLDFLSQEFNRECNTICSKSNAASVTSLGLEMKVIIDQFREQVQNIQ